MEERGRNEHSELLVKFENMLKSNSNQYFDLDEYEELIEHYLDEGKYKKAQKAIKYGQEQFPYSSIILVKKAHLALFTDKTTEIISEIHDYFEHNEFDEELLTILSTLYLDENKLSKSIQCVDKLVELYGETSDFHYLYGSCYLTAGKYPKAIKHFKKSIELDVENEAALYDLAYCLELKGELDKSIQFYKKFIDQDPYSYYAWYNLGVIYNKLSRYKDAIDSFEYAIAINDEFSSALYNLGNTYVMLGKWNEAIHSFKRCLTIEIPSADLYAKLGECYELKGAIQKSIEYYKKALDINPEMESALLGMTIILQNRGKHKEALHYMQKCIKINNHRFDYWLMLAKCEASLGNDFSASEAFNKALKLNNTDSNCYKEYVIYLIEIDELEKALSIIEVGVEHLPNHGELYYLGGVLCLKQGKYKEAISYLENALFLAPDKKETLYSYFESLDEQKAILALIDSIGN